MNATSSSQRGSTLVISLMILIVMTLIGLTGVMTSTLEEKMAGNTRNQALAFQAAEAALRDGESYYENTVIVLGAAFDGSNTGLYPAGSNPDLLSGGTWENSREYSGTIEHVAEKPRYIIELIGPIGNNDSNEKLNMEDKKYEGVTDTGIATAVRVSARATGGTANTQVVLQSYYRN